MTATSKWAQRRWENDLYSKLCGPGVGNKNWWSLVKERQGTSHQETIPPLTRQNGTTAASSKEKTHLLADIFSAKMTVADPNRPPPQLAQECDQTVTTVVVTQERVEHLLKAVDVRKASGPDDVSSQVLRHCSSELAGSLTEVFTSCVQEDTWPSIWKGARVVPVHKKKSRSDPANYRPISLLSVVGKVFERIVVETLTHHLDKKNPSCPTISSGSDLAAPPQTFSCFSTGTGKTPWITAWIPLSSLSTLWEPSTVCGTRVCWKSSVPRTFKVTF